MLVIPQQKYLFEVLLLAQYGNGHRNLLQELQQLYVTAKLKAGHRLYTTIGSLSM
jgi:hypothetical protein